MLQIILFKSRNQKFFFKNLKNINMPQIIFVKTMDEGSCTLQVDIKNDKVKELLKKYAQKINEKEENICLVFAGKLLQGYLENYLYELSIQPNSTLMSVMRLEGGKGKIVKMVIKDVNNREHEIEFNDDKTVNQLKQHIYENLCQSLEPNLMSLQYAGVQIQNNKKLSFYKLVQVTGVRKIIQNKVGLGKIAGIILAYEVDSLGFEENETYRMPCGHVVGREGMIAYIKSLVDGNQFKINCPAKKPNGDHCNYEWDYQICRKIGVFTAEENNLFQVGLSKNCIKRNSSECPKCRIKLLKGSLKSNRVKCSNCQFGVYCFECSKLWKSSDKDFCGNDDCESVKKVLDKVEWNKSLQLLTNGIKQTYMLPSVRLCPGCHIKIFIGDGCKRMLCEACKMNFCWVCLAVKTNGLWPCGNNYKEYCGKIAQIQHYE